MPSICWCARSRWKGSRRLPGFRECPAPMLLWWSRTRQRRSRRILPCSGCCGRSRISSGTTRIIMSGCAARRRCARLVQRKCSRPLAPSFKCQPDFVQERARDVLANRNPLPSEMSQTRFIPRFVLYCLAVAWFPNAVSSPPLRATEPNGAAGSEHDHGAGGSHVSRDFNGVLPTSENLTLRLNTDLGSVHIVPLQSGAPPVIRYTVHLETDARRGAAAELLDHYVFSAKTTPAGVEISGNLPQLPRGTGGAQVWVHFEVSVPASYSLDITTGTGDIDTFDVGGTATLVTEGGNIVGGRIGTNFMRGPG